MILTGLIFGLLSFAQNPNIAVFPNGFAGDNNLFVAKDLASSILASNITSSQLTIPVTVGSVFVAPSLVTIDNETISICSISSNTLNVCTNGRGFNNTSAVSHISGKVVYAGISSYYFNQLAAETKSIELYLGSHPYIKPSFYNFAPINLNTPLISGIGASVVLAPCPSGLKGNSSSYLYINDGGVSEAVLITGLTGVSPSSSCTVSFTPSQNHSVYTLGSATSGAQEALNANSSNLSETLFFDVGTTVLKSPVDIWTHHTTLLGAGSGTQIDCQINSGSCFDYNGTQTSGGIGSGNQFLNMVVSNVAQTFGSSRTLININEQNTFTIWNVELFFGTTAINLEGADTFAVFLNTFKIGELEPTTGKGIVANMAGDLYVSHGYINGVGPTSQAAVGMELVNGGGFYIENVSGIDVTNHLKIDPGTGQFVDYVFGTQNIYDQSAGDAFLIHPTGNGYVSTVFYTNSWTSTSALNGFHCLTSDTGTVTGVNLIGHRAFNNGQSGIHFESGCSNFTISSSLVTQNSVSSYGNFYGVQIDNNVNNFTITDVRAGQVPGFLDTQGDGIVIEGPNNDYVNVSNIDASLPNHGGSVFFDNSTGTHKVISTQQKVSSTITSASVLDPSQSDPDILILTGSVTPIKSISRGWDGRNLTIINTGTNTLTIGDGTGNIKNISTIAPDGVVNCHFVAGFGLWWCK